MDRKMTLQQAADIFGVHTSTISEWESDLKKPKPYQNPKVIKFLDFIPFTPLSRASFHTFEFYCLALGYSRVEAGNIIGSTTDIIHRYERDKHHLISRKARDICDEGLKLFEQQFVDQNFNT